jgi:hypothetical protein
VRSVERSDGGKFISRSYKDGVQYGGQVVGRWWTSLEMSWRRLGKGLGVRCRMRVVQLGDCFPSGIPFRIVEDKV